MTETIEPRLLTPTQSGIRLGIGRSKVYELMQSGQLASVKIGRSRRIHIDVVDAFIDSLANAS
jgi:excisionase family DNA binding protein